VYQEQLIEMAQKLAGFTFAEADGLRKSCAKKVSDILDLIEPKFREGCRKNNIPESVIDEMWNISTEFGSYAFNKSHCLSEDSLLFNKKNKEFIKVKDVKEGDILDSYFEGDIVEDEVVKLIDAGIQEVYEIEISNGQKIECTLDHKFLCSDEKYRTVKDIIKGDFEIIYKDLDGENIKKCKITSIKKNGKKQTYNISMKSKQHNYSVFGDAGTSYIISKNSAAYGFITYQTAFLKTYYPAEFISALLTSAANVSDEKLEIVTNKIMKEFPKMEILKPQINQSKSTYYPINKNKRDIKLMAPLFSLKGIGKKASDDIVSERVKLGLDGFISMNAFLRTINSGGKALISNAVGNVLIDSGVFDEFGSRSTVREEMLRYTAIKKGTSRGKKNFTDEAVIGQMAELFIV